MAVVRKHSYTVDPVLLGDYAAHAASRPAARENRQRSIQTGLQVAELNQRAQVANAGFDQRDADRQYDWATRQMQAGAMLEANRQDNARALQQTQDAADFRMQEAEFKSDLDARDKASGLFLPPDAARGGVQAHELALNNKRLLGMPEQLFEEELLKKVAGGDIEATKQAMAYGYLAYTPQQKQQIAELQDGLAQLNDPRLSPIDRVRGQRQIQEKLAAIRPVPVPSDEREPSLDERIRQSIGTWTNPIDGKPYPFTINRNGVPELLDLGQEAKKEPEKPTSIVGKLQTDPDFKSKFISDAYNRVAERKKAEIAKAQANALNPEAFKAAAAMSAIPLPEEVDAEIATMLKTAEMLDGRLGGGTMQPGMTGQTGTMPQPGAVPQPGMPGQQGPLPPDAPPPAVVKGISAAAAAAGKTVKPAGRATEKGITPSAPGQPPQQQKPFEEPTAFNPMPAQSKPKPGLPEHEVLRMAGLVQKLLAKQQAQGGRLSHNDAMLLKALYEDLGIQYQ